MKPINGYEESQAYIGEGYKQLPLGGHICKIKGVKIKSCAWGDRLEIAFDIADGNDFDGYFQQKFESSKTSNPEAEWPHTGRYSQLIPHSINEDNSDKNKNTMKFFKGFITSIEASNLNYKWNPKAPNEKSLVGKVFGGIFGREEYENSSGESKFSTKCRYVRSTKDIFDAEVPKDKLLSVSNAETSSFENVSSDDDLPF